MADICLSNLLETKSRLFIPFIYLFSIHLSGRIKQFNLSCLLLLL